MTRLLLSCSLVAALTSLAAADRAPEPRFAQPPQGIAYREPEARPARALDRTTVRAALARARTANLAAFRAYVATGTYPSNVYRSGLLNVWRDQDGHYCAAATIIRMSGQDELVARVAEQNNSIRLAVVSQGPLMDWILTSGLTQDEIALIQRPFMPVTEHPQAMPIAHVDVDAKLRAAETARLAASYRAIEKTLVAQQKRSLDLAVQRVMRHPTLAWQLIDG
jgi:hypothetical protein